MPTPLEPFWGAVHSSLQEQLQIISPYLWSALPILERAGRACCYVRLARLRLSSAHSPTNEGVVIAGCTLMAGSFFPSLEKGIKAVLAAQCARHLFSECLVLKAAAWHFTTIVSGKYPSPNPRLSFQDSLFSPSFTHPIQRQWQRTAAFISLLCQAIWQAVRALFSCALLLGEISLVMQGETAIQFTLLSFLASAKRRVDEEGEDALHSLAVEEEHQVDWMDCIRTKCGLGTETGPPPRFSPSRIVEDSWRDLRRTVWSPGKITSFSIQLSPSLQPISQMGRFPPIWKEDPSPSPAKVSPHPLVKRSLFGLFSTFFQEK